MTTITATSVSDGNSPVTGTLCLTPVNQYHTSIAITKSGGGFYEAGQAFCQPLSAGALTGSLSVPNPVTDSAPGHGYNLVIYNATTGQSSDPLFIPSIGGSSWSLDTYVPAYTIPTTNAFTLTTGSGTAPTSCVAPALDYRINAGSATQSVCSGGVFVTVTGVAGPTGATGPPGADGVASVASLAALFSKQPYITGNLYNHAAASAGYINNTNGGFGTGGTVYVASDYMPCNAGGSMTSSVAVSSFSSPIVGLAFYDQNQAYVSGIPGPLSTWTCPSTAAFVRVTYDAALAPLAIVVYGSSIPSNLATLTTTGARSQIARFSQLAIQNSRSVGANLFDSTAISNDNLLVVGNGTLGADPNHYVSDYIPVVGGMSYAMALGDSESAPAFGLCWYDVDKNFISGIPLPFTNGQVFTAPQNAAFTRFPGLNGALGGTANSIPLQMFTLGSTPASYRPFLGRPTFNFGHAQVDINYRFTRKLGLDPTDKILLYGDSRSSTDYPFNATIMATLTGAQVYNGGWSGHTAGMNASHADTARIYRYAPNVVFALLGGNDSGAAGTVGTFSGAVAGEPTVTQVSLASDYSGTYFIQAIDYFIRDFNAHYYNIRSRAGLTGSESESVKNAMIAAVQPKPALYLATDIPQQRNNPSDPTSIPANWQRKHDAIMEVCALDHVQCIDTLTLTPFASNMSAEPFWTSPTNTSTNNGVYYMDGLHLNQFGWEILAQLYCWFAGL